MSDLPSLAWLQDRARDISRGRALRVLAVAERSAKLEGAILPAITLLGVGECDKSREKIEFALTLFGIEDTDAILAEELASFETALEGVLSRAKVEAPNCTALVVLFSGSPMSDLTPVLDVIRRIGVDSGMVVSSVYLVATERIYCVTPGCPHADAFCLPVDGVERSQVGPEVAEDVKRAWPEVSQRLEYLRASGEPLADRHVFDAAIYTWLNRGLDGLTPEGCDRIRAALGDSRLPILLLLMMSSSKVCGLLSSIPPHLAAGRVMDIYSDKGGLAQALLGPITVDPDRVVKDVKLLAQDGGQMAMALLAATYIKQGDLDSAEETLRKVEGASSFSVLVGAMVKFAKEAKS